MPSVTTFHATGTAIVCDPPIVMGVVNVTPDSFFDGGTVYDPADATPAIAHGVALFDAGARIVDVGGESTRPHAKPVSVSEERDRVLPVVAGLVDAGVTVSIDTRNAPVAAACLDAGAAIVNDVSAGTHDPDMFDTVIGANAGFVLMHMQGTPETMQHDPTYEDVVQDVAAFLRARLDAFVQAGGNRGNIVVDPGIGFGKTVAHNLALMKNLDVLHTLGCPVLVGVSHKSVLGAVTGRNEPALRHAATTAAHALLATRGAQILRAHDVAATVDALAVADAFG